MTPAQTPVRFGSLNVGDAFSLHALHKDGHPDYHWNIKVADAKVANTDDFGVFNVISLVDGRPRTFHTDSLVYQRNLHVALERDEAVTIAIMTDNGF